MSYTNFPSRSGRRYSRDYASSGAQLPPSMQSGDNEQDSWHSAQRPPSGLYAPPDGVPAAYTNANGHRNIQDWNYPVYNHAYLDDQHPSSRRGSADSDATLNDDERVGRVEDVTFNSYRHPYDIQPPSRAGQTHNSPFGINHRPSFGPLGTSVQESSSTRLEHNSQNGNVVPQDERYRGIYANILHLQGIDIYDEDDSSAASAIRHLRRPSTGSRPFGHRRIDDLAPCADQIIDPDDPTVTGVRKAHQEDPEDLEKNILRDMTYQQRRKERQRMRIEVNVTSILNRQVFLMTLARALMVFGAPSHRIESQLLSAARILEIDAEYVCLPGVIICSFGDPDTKTTDTHFLKAGGRLSLGALHEVHQIYRAVVHDEISAKKATQKLEDLLEAPSVYNAYIRCILAFLISALICPLAFGGSIADMWFAGIGGVTLCLMHFWSAKKSSIYATVFEISVTCFISFLARALSSIPSQKFCYTAISSAGIVSILPGYLILTSSLELASKNIVCGSIKMVYALIYTLFIGFGLQVGSDFYLLFDESSRVKLEAISEGMAAAVALSGNFVADNPSIILNDHGAHIFSGSFSFSNSAPVHRDHIIKGCYRDPVFPWYLQPFPWWTQFFTVPIFSSLSSLANLQPWKTWDYPVMVIISCVSYATNKISDHFIFRRSDVVSAIGAFVVGLCGNVYSRKLGGTAFTSMVTGVLFLVPSGLSEAGGITAQGNGIEIGHAMVSVSIGITTGLFMSQTIVYMFGSRKNGASFSF
ncbi:DUF1212-domain-containing protein [Panus rudis PR-1116 ss-1]|nr:DUF1212-domain-containing protein [Panus rudis PR-1116 ss-1]